MNIHQKTQYARLTIIAAVLFMAIQPAHAQGQVRLSPGRADAPYLECIRNRTAALIRQGDSRALRSVEATRQGYQYGIGPPKYARAYKSMLRENERVCEKAR